MSRNFSAAAALAGVLAIMPFGAAAQTPINVSYQPSLYWALPYYVATEKGWWKEVGLAPSFSVFPAGAPQVARRAGEILGRGWHRLGSRGAGRRAFGSSHDRHHQ